MSSRRRLTALGICLGLVGAAGVPTVATATTVPEPCDWNGFANGNANTGRADECTELGVDNVATLTPQLLYRTRDSVTSTPIVVDGRLYVGDWTGTFYAFDADAAGVGDPTLSSSFDGLPLVEPLWTYDTRDHDTNDVSFGRIVSTAMVGEVDGRDVVVVAGGATIFVFEADDDGGLLATACLDPRAIGADRCQGSDGDVEVESSPRLHRDEVTGDLLVTVGMDVHNKAGVGRAGVVQLRLADTDAGWSLRPVWKFDPEGIGDPDGLNGTYTPDNTADPLTYGSGTGDGCSGVWGTPAVDEANDLVVFGTSSCKLGEPDGSSTTLGSGDVVGESVFAVTRSTGELIWRYDPPRPWGTKTDDDFGSSAQLFTADLDGDGIPQSAVGIGGKDGWYYAFDRDPAVADGDGDGTATPAWRSHLGQSGHANDDFAIGGIIGTPAVGETLRVTKTGLVSRPAIFATTAISTPVGAPVDYCFTPEDFQSDPTCNLEKVDDELLLDPGRMLSLHAIDAATGDVLWRQPLHRQSYGHPTFVPGTGDLPGMVVVAATAGFAVHAFDATTGALVTTRPLNSAPSSGVAVTRDSIYVGAGTRQNDAGYKAFEGDDPIRDGLSDLVGEDPQERLAGIWSFRLAV